MENFLKTSAISQLLGVIIFASISWCGFFLLKVDKFLDTDPTLYAGVARNGTLGYGLFSTATSPVFLKYFQKDLPWPAFTPPLLSYGQVTSFYIFGVSNTSAIIPNFFYYISNLVLVYTIAVRSFTKKVGLVSSLFYILSPQLLIPSITGYSETLFTFIILTATYFYLFKRNYIFLGFISGLGLLTKTTGIFLLVSFMSKKSVIKIVIGFLFVYIVSNSLLPPLAQSYPKLSEHQLWRVIAMDALVPAINITRTQNDTITLSRLVSGSDLILKKIITQFYELIKNLASISSPVVFLFLFSSTQHPIKKILLKIGTLLLGFHLMTIALPRYFYPLIPLALILFSKELTQKLLSVTTVILTLYFVFAPGLLSSIIPTLNKRNLPNIYEKMNELISVNVGNQYTIATDDFAQISWYTRRRSLQLPIFKEHTTTDFQFVLLFTYPNKHEYEASWQLLIDKPQNTPSLKLISTYSIPAKTNHQNLNVRAVLYKLL